jgi:hypothetical protein
MWIGVGAMNLPGTPAGQTQGGISGTSFAEAPVVSPRSKLVVETGGAQPTFQTASDTLAPESLDPFGDGPGMILTGTEDRTNTRYLGESLMGD